MNHKEIVKYFYEYVVSNHCIDDVDKFVSGNCTLRTGKDIIPVG